MKSICILGLGYIGLPTAAMFANNDCKVYGVDINDKIIEIINNGDIHIKELGLKTLVQAAIKSGNLTVSCQPQPADAFIIAVPTPFKHNEFGEYEGKKYKLADMSFVASAAEAVVPHLQKGNLVILESTSPVRTIVDLVRPILEKSGLKAGEDFYLVYSPERVLPGQILKELIENARVIGGIDKESAEKGKELYSAFVKGEIVLTDATTAEMVKLMENAYRDVNIAIANEFSRLAYRFGVDVWEAIKIANLHPRVKILNPGPGVGGHCISIDPWFLVEEAPDIASLIFSARQINDFQPDFVVESALRLLGNSKNRRIAALGLSYKSDVDDFRESPAIEIVERLLALGYEVQAYDPYVKHSTAQYMVGSLDDAVNGADLAILLVDHTEFKSLTPEMLEKMRQRKLFDTRHCLDKNIWKQAGFEFSVLGDPR